VEKEEDRKEAEIILVTDGTYLEDQRVEGTII
jgi:hypothetical protein